jgi:hypothetical protein
VHNTRGCGFLRVSSSLALALETRIVGGPTQMGIKRTVIAGSVVLLVLAGVITAAGAQNERKHMGMAGLPKMPAAFDNKWENVFRRGTDLRLKGNYSEALSAIKQSVALARADKNFRKIAVWWELWPRPPTPLFLPRILLSCRD